MERTESKPGAGPPARAAGLGARLDFKQVFRYARDILLIIEQDGSLIDCNEAAVAAYGYDRDELLRLNVRALRAPETLASIDAELRRAWEPDGLVFETVHLRKDGSTFPVEVSSRRIDLGTEGFRLSVIRDVTLHKAAEANVQRQVLLYAALSQCNQAIAQSASEQELYSRICRAAVEFGGMKMAWVGVVDAQSKQVRPVANFGDGLEYLREIAISADVRSPVGRGPTGTAIRENRPFWCQDFPNDSATEPWHERGARHGWAASASLPLRRNGSVIGALTLYSGETGAFGESTRGLLVDIADNVSFALDNFAREARRVAAEEALREKEHFLSESQRIAHIGGWSWDLSGPIKWTDETYRIYGVSPDSFIPTTESLVGLIHPEDQPALLRWLEACAAGERPPDLEFRTLMRDGTVRVLSGRGELEFDADNRPVRMAGTVQDITEKKRIEDDVKRYIAEVETALRSTVEVATTLSEMRDPYTAGHERRVAEIAVAMAARLGFDERRQEGLRVAGYLHDVGKITIPAEILSKPGRLSPVEFALIQGHAQSSYDVLKRVAFPWPVAEVALQHHERMDGSGYPQGLKGEALMLEARIMAVADVIEAMSSHRPYRAALGIDQALAELEHGRGSLYDAAVVDVCLRMFREQQFRLPA